MNTTPWKPADIAYLLANYGRGRNAEVAAELGRTEKAIMHKFYDMGGRVVRPKHRRTVPPGARAGFELLVEAMIKRELMF